jgi:hypothetical protein
MRATSPFQRWIQTLAMVRQQKNPVRRIRCHLLVRKRRQHLRFVARQPCLVCSREPCNPHHLRFAQPRGLGQKVSDEFTVRFAEHTIANCTAPKKRENGG